MQSIYSDILDVLSGGGNYPIRYLQQRLQISQTKIEFALQDLRAWQVPLEQQDNNYYLTKPLILLNKNELYAALSPASLSELETMLIFNQIDSSNQYLLQRQKINCGICLSEYQTAGRGQQGKKWWSPFASGLCLSLVYTYPQPPPVGLSLAFAVVLVKYLSNLGVQDLGVKWPNDIIWQHQYKLAGLLVEMQTNQTACRVVVGLGINLDAVENEKSQANDYMPVGLAQMLSTTNRPNRNQLAAQIINLFLAVLSGFPNQKLLAYLPDWQQFDVLAGHKVTVTQGQTTLQGHADGINTQGALRLIQSGGNCLPITHGSVRIAEDW